MSEADRAAKAPGPADAGASGAVAALDPLDMRNYGLEKLQEIQPGKWMAKAKLARKACAVRRMAPRFIGFEMPSTPMPK